MDEIFRGPNKAKRTRNILIAVRVVIILAAIITAIVLVYLKGKY